MRQKLQLWLGLALLPVAIILFVAPIGPIGTISLALSLWLILRNAFWARRRFLRLVQRYPKFLQPLYRLLKRRQS